MVLVNRHYLPGTCACQYLEGCGLQVAMVRSLTRVIGTRVLAWWLLLKLIWSISYFSFHL